jgi:4a-hydroxytetrahydrobiopterin dehydratase
MDSSGGSYESGDEHCRPDVGELTERQARELAAQIPEWHLVQHMHETELEFEKFVDATSSVNQVAEIIEQQDHHRDINISYSDAALTLITCRVYGLTRNDFVMAATVDALLA